MRLASLGPFSPAHVSVTSATPDGARQNVGDSFSAHHFQITDSTGSSRPIPHGSSSLIGCGDGNVSRVNDFFVAG
jgi:hypothetical protein